MHVVADALDLNEQHEAAAGIYEHHLANLQRSRPDNTGCILDAKNNLADCYNSLDRHQDALHLMRQVYRESVDLDGREDRGTLISAGLLGLCLIRNKLFVEAKRFLRKELSLAQEALGRDHNATLNLSSYLYQALDEDPKSTREDLVEAERIITDTVQRRRRVFGPAHPDTREVEDYLAKVREKLARMYPG